MRRVEVVMTKKARNVAAGTRRTMSSQEAKVLVLLGAAEYAPAADEVAAQAQARKRTYQRRDMVATPTRAVPATFAKPDDEGDGEA